ncbi:MAG: DIP1984 family protein [Chloroflexota bacterium]
MRLAEALVMRADTKKRIEQLRQRLIRNAKVQEGEKPAEDPQALLDEMEKLSDELVKLIQKINKTNTVIEIEKGLTIADAIAQRDVLMLKQNSYRELAQAATITQDVRTKSEIKFKGTVKVAEIQEKADKAAKAHREIDTKIQEMNWRTDLLE